jgi:hypothetical protein
MVSWTAALAVSELTSPLSWMPELSYLVTLFVESERSNSERETARGCFGVAMSRWMADGSCHVSGRRLRSLFPQIQILPSIQRRLEGGATTSTTTSMTTHSSMYMVAHSPNRRTWDRGGATWRLIHLRLLTLKEASYPTHLVEMVMCTLGVLCTLGV